MIETFLAVVIGGFALYCYYWLAFSGIIFGAEWLFGADAHGSILVLLTAMFAPILVPMITALVVQYKTSV